MPWRWACLLLVGLYVASTTRASAAEAAPATSILVQRIATAGAATDAARGLEDALVLELGHRAGVRVVTAAELEQTIDVARTSAELGCDLDERCLREVRSKLAVSTVLSGTLGKLGDELFFTVSVVDASHGSVKARITVQAADVVGLEAQLPTAVDRILGKSTPAAAFRLPDGEELKLAVMPLSARGVPESTADAMSQILSSELNQIAGLTVLSRDDIRAMLDKGALEAQLGCIDNLECIVEIGAALGLSKLVSGSVGRLDASFVISLQLIDTREAHVVNRVLESFVGAESELKNAIKLAAYQLVGVDYRAKPGALRLSFNVDRADVRLGARALRVQRGRLDVPDVSPGRYSLQVHAEGDDFSPYQTDVYVPPSATNVRLIELRARPARWYKSWWFWTATGVVLAGSGTLSAYLLTRGETGNGSGVATIMGAR